MVAQSKCSRTCGFLIYQRLLSPMCRILLLKLIVEELMSREKRVWDLGNILEIFPPALAAKISQIAILPSNQPDKISWGPEKRGQFSVKSCYKLISNHGYNPEGSNASRLGQF